ncbi:hypothetical protein J3R30DRAFT_3579786 [Lentinula aciculospora]|uniref:Uncharacterized protein n=1 Tax=Lentinula aciculospora TaxID=153920 RepID=A0A9W8ZW03_9AGAR|nr:hypothetical protein J3R30DRAFT_3579786 [Lentinula aciculospora]
MFLERGGITQHVGINLAAGKGGKRGIYNGGVYTYEGSYLPGYPLDKLVIKVLTEPLKTGDMYSYGEAKALDDVGLYVDSGLLECTKRKKRIHNTGKVETVDEDVLLPAIIMKRVGGVPIEETAIWRAVGKVGRNLMINDAKPLVKTKFMDLWNRFQFVYM